MKRYTAFSKALILPKPHHHILVSNEDTRFIPCKEIVGIFYNHSRLGNRRKWTRQNEFKYNLPVLYDGMILTGQPIWGYFMPRGYGIAFIRTFLYIFSCD